MKKEVIEFLPQFIKDVVTEYEEVEGVSPEMTLPIMLAILSFACQAILDANPGRWRRSPLSLLVTVLAESGQRKSAIYDRLKEGIVKWQDEQVVVAKANASQYLVEMKQYEAEIRDRAKDKDTDWTTEPPLFEPQLPRNWRHLFEKFTTNGLLKDLERVPHAFIVNTDAAEFFNSHAFQNSGTDTEIITAMSKVWSGEPITKSTGIEEKYVANRRASALFMIQAGQAKFLKDPRFKDQGFTNRVLISQPPLIEEEETVSMFDTTNDHKKAKLDKAIDTFNERVYDLLKSTANVKNKGLANMRQALIDTKDKNELFLDVIKIEKEAEEVYDEVYQSLQKVKKQKYYKEPGFYAEYEAFINREFEHFIRIAGVISVCQFKDSVSLEDAWCAKMIKDFFVEQRQHLELDIVKDKDSVVTTAEDLWKQLKKWTIHPEIIPESIQKEFGDRGGFTKTMMNNYCIKSYADMTKPIKDRVLTEMVSREWIIVEPIKGGGNLVKLVL